MEAERGSASTAMDDDDYIAIGHFGMAYMLDTPSGGYLHHLHLHTFKQAIELSPSFSPPVHGEHATIPNYLDYEA
jgi:hypothetical protein